MKNYIHISTYNLYIDFFSKIIHLNITVRDQKNIYYVEFFKERHDTRTYIDDLAL